MTRFAVIAAAACTLVARGAQAYRPFEGTDADVAETGELELEIGPVQALRSHGTTTYDPGFTFNDGISKGFELVIDTDGLVPLGTAPGDALLVADVLVKHVLRAGCLQGGHGPSVAMETGVLLPTLPAHGVDEAGWSLAMIVSQRWAAVTVHLNLQGEYDRDRQLTAFASAIVEGPITWAVRPVAELLLERDGDTGALASALAGVIWRARKDVSFDAAARMQDERGVTTVELRAGLTWTVSS